MSVSALTTVLCSPERLRKLAVSCMAICKFKGCQHRGPQTFSSTPSFLPGSYTHITFYWAQFDLLVKASWMARLN